MDRNVLLFACSLAVGTLTVGLSGCNSNDEATTAAAPAPGPGPAPAPTPPPPAPPPPAPPPPSPTPPPSGTPTLQRSTVTTAVSPWDLAFLPDGTFFYTERGRGLSVRSGGTTRHLFGIAGASLIAIDFVVDGQSGMCGVAVDPDFASNRAVYVYMASTLGGTKSNRVVRLTLDAGLTTVVSRTDIVSGITYKIDPPRPGQLTGQGDHSGGRMRFGPDGYLYVTTGDTHNAFVPQSGTMLGGKVLRIDRNGAAAPGNNPPSGFDPRIYTYGHRNVQGISFRPTNGQPFISEHGPGHTDEVTPLVAGGNGGWDPVCLDGATYCGYGSNQQNGTLTPMTDTAKFPSALRASWTNNGASQGMGPNTFLTGTQWRDWNGRLLVGVMGAQRLDVLQLDAAGMSTNRVTVSGLPAQRYRSVVMGPDGNLYIAVDGGEIWRVVPN